MEATATTKFNVTVKDVAIVGTNVLASSLYVAFRALSEASAHGGATIVNLLDKNISKQEAIDHYVGIGDKRLSKLSLRDRMK